MRAREMIDNRFEIERLLGAGGMGQVYAARDRDSGEAVAVKVLLASGLHEHQRFAREAQALASLRMPGVVRYIAHGLTAAGQAYLAMELVSGETLSERLARRPPSPAESVALVKRIAVTLGAIHRLGVVHRDIKPSNIMLVDRSIERALLLDFGVARITGLSEQLTKAGSILGTPGYMAPEQARGQLQVDARADVFALGCVLYRCLTGQPAFRGASGLAVLAKVIIEEPPRVRELRPDIPAPLDSLVSRMLAKAPENRPPDGIAVAAELSGLTPLVAGAPTSWEESPDEATGATATLSPSFLAAGPPSTVRATEITASERKLMCVVIARNVAEPDATLTEVDDGRRAAALRELAEHYQAELELVDARTPLLVFSGSLAPTDLAARAARCALRLQAQLDGAPVALVTGRVELAERLSVGELIDRAVQTLTRGDTMPDVPHVLIDDVTAGLVSTRFRCSQAPGHRYLEAPADENSAQPRLLGRSTPFVGRDREMELLVNELSQCFEEPVSTFALVTGPVGMGKSRIRQEFLARVMSREEAVTVWTGQSDPISAGSAFGLLSSALKGELAIGDNEPMASRQDKVRTRVARHRALDARRVSAFLGELIGVPFPDEADVQLRAARRNPMLMNDQLQLAWEEFVRAECAEQPVLLVLEDLQWGDLPTVTLVDAALRQLNDLPFMVLALGRPEVHELFPRLWEGRRGQQLRLTPLTRKAGERLVRASLGGAASDELVARLVERAEGNAFYLEELIRAAASGQDTALPETVLAMVQTRIEALSAGARRVLRAASIFGQAFWQGGVAVLLGVTEVTAQLVDLERREIVTRRDAGHRAGDVEYRFRHALVREAAYGMLTDRDRRAGHALAGSFLEQAGHDDPMALAEHFDRGGEPARAARAYLRAAEQALRGSDLQAAIDRAERGMAFEPEPEVAGALRHVQAEAHIWRGDIALAEERGTEAVERLPAGSARWFMAMIHVVKACGKQGALDRVARRTAVARDAPIAAGALRARTACLSGCANGAIFRGEYATADALLDAIDRSMQGAGTLDPDALAQLYQTRAFRSVSAGDPESSLDNFAAVLRAFEEAGDRRNACTARMNLAFFHLELGDFAGAESLLRAALAAAEPMGLREAVANIQNNLGHALAYAGKLDEANAVEGAALETMQAMGVPRLIGSALTYLAKIALFAGDFATAARHATAAADVLEVAPPLRPAAVAVLAQALLGLGRPEEALAAAREAYSALESLGGVEEGESLIRLTHAEALAAAGLQAEAAKAISSAEAALLARAEKFKQVRWRDSFLGSIPEHARTRELARQWLGRDSAP